MGQGFETRGTTARVNADRESCGISAPGWNWQEECQRIKNAAGPITDSVNSATMRRNAFNNFDLGSSKLANHVLEVLQRSNLDHVTSRLGFEDSFFARKGVEALTFFGCGFALDHDFAEAGD